MRIQNLCLSILFAILLLVIVCASFSDTPESSLLYFQIDTTLLSDSLGADDSSEEFSSEVLSNTEISEIESSDEESYEEPFVPDPPCEVTGEWKSWTHYTVYADDSKQEILQRIAYTDENGLRKVGEYFCVALGSYYGTEIGLVYEITLDDNGILKTFKAVLCDQKSDRHTDPTHRYTESHGCIVEFCIDKNVASQKNQIVYHGTVGLLDEFRGSVVKVETIGKMDIFTGDVMLGEVEESEPELEPYGFVGINEYIDPRNSRTFNMPMSLEYQKYVYELCEQYNISYTFVMAIMGAETGWDVHIGQRGDYYGVGMVSITYAKDKLAENGIDLLTVDGSVEAVVFIVSEKLKRFQDEEMAAMAYNIGTYGAIDNYFDKGIYSTAYSRRVIELKQALEDAMKTKENHHEQASN